MLISTFRQNTNENVSVEVGSLFYNYLLSLVSLHFRLFESHPDVQNVFQPFKGMSPEDLSHSNQLRSHAMRVMGTVDKCLDCVNDQNMVVKVLHELGARHVMYTAKVDYMDVSI